MGYYYCVATKHVKTMRYLKGFVVLFFMSSLFLNASGQLVSRLHELYHPAYYLQEQNDTSTFEPWSKLSGKTDYSFEVGSSFSSYGGGISSSYISPRVSFMATERLQIVAGGKFSYANTGSIPLLGTELGQSPNSLGTGNPTEAFAYGRYKVNEKLSVYGMGAFGKNQLYMSPFESGVGTTDYQHLSFGMDYKISDKVSIGASFGVNNGPAWGVSPFGGFGQQRMNPFFP